MKTVLLPLALALAVPGVRVLHSESSSKDKNKPTIQVKASPPIAFSPARVVFTADIKGGADDDEQFYCADVEWNWGDGTESESSADCDPYQAGKSEIKRHFAADRVFQTSGDYRIEFKLKRKDKVIALGSTLVKIRPGVRDGGGG